MAMLIRWQLARPGQPVPLVGRLLFPGAGGVISPAAYTSLFTMHGTIMIFFAVTPILIGGFGNFCVPLLIGARDMAFPRLNMLSFWTMAAATATLTASFFVPLGAAAGGLDRLRDAVDGDRRARRRPDDVDGRRSTSTASSSVMGAVNYITTVVRLRAPGMTWFRLPLTVWGFFLTSILNALFVPGAGGGDGAAVLRPRLRHAVLHRRQHDPRGRRSDPVPAPVLAVRPPGGLHPDPARLGDRQRPAVVLRAQAGVRLPGDGVVADRRRGPVVRRLRPPHVHHRHEPAARRELHGADDDHLRADVAAVPQLAGDVVARRRAHARRRCCSAWGWCSPSASAG